jgi:hypothetical protein
LRDKDCGRRSEIDDGPNQPISRSAFIRIDPIDSGAAIEKPLPFFFCTGARVFEL